MIAHWDALVGFWIYEVGVALSPLIIAGVFVVYMLKWTSASNFIGEGDLFPWALPISGIALRRAAISNLQIDFLFLTGFVVLTFAVFGYAISCYVRYKSPRNQVNIHRVRLAWSSVFMAAIALFVGSWAAVL